MREINEVAACPVVRSFGSHPSLSLLGVSFLAGQSRKQAQSSGAGDRGWTGNRGELQDCEGGRERCVRLFMDKISPCWKVLRKLGGLSSHLNGAL